MSMSTAHRPYSTSSKATPATTAMVKALKTRCSMAGIIGASALPFGVINENSLTTLAVPPSALSRRGIEPHAEARVLQTP